MAIRPCIECKREISDEADPCPHCGKRNPHGKRTSNIVRFGGSFLLLCGASVVVLPLVLPSRDVSAPVAATAIQAPVGVATIPDGVHAVGQGIAPGVYRVGSYWERRDRNQVLLENGLTRGGCPTLLVVRETDSFVEINGGAVRADDTTIDPIAQGCTFGMFLVGKDIKPGTYRLRADTEQAYWSRLDSKLGTIANDIGNGDRAVTVRESDFAIEISGGTLLAP